MPRADPELLNEIYRFCLARAKEIANGDIPGLGWEQRESGQSMIRLFVSTRKDVDTHPWSGAAAVDYFRERAMRWKDHPDFDPIWTIEV